MWRMCCLVAVLLLGTSLPSEAVAPSFVFPEGGFSGLVNANRVQDGFGAIQFQTSYRDKVTGKIYVNGLTVKFSGEFTEGGSSASFSGNFTGKRSGQPVNLGLTLLIQSDGLHFTGTLTGDGPSYNISGERNAYGSTLIPIPAAGIYNALMDGNAPPAGGGPLRALARVTMKPSGTGTVAGVLPDGTKFTAAARASVLGHVYFQGGVYKKESGKFTGYILGTLTLDPNSTPKSLSGPALWTKPANNGPIYPTGVLKEALTVAASLYTPPPHGQRIIPDFDSASGAGGVVLADGNLATPLTDAVTIDTNNKVTVTMPGADKLKLTLSSATGLITGSFVHDDGKTHKIFGIFVQSSPGRAEGLFPGTDSAGTLTILPPP